MATGFVYALINASMPGLVKVGRTVKDPRERASELSAATGVATPFLVVYHDYFADVEAAEAWVHETLQHRGYRVATNREFFNAEVVDVIKTIAACPGKIAPQAVMGDEPGFDALSPGDKLFAQAEEYYFGLGDVIQDYLQALPLYKQAARLGSLDAFSRLGEMSLYANGVRQNNQLALRHFSEGAQKGNFHCYRRMAEIYCYQFEEDNFRKCWSRFFEQAGRSNRAFKCSTQAESIWWIIHHPFLRDWPIDISHPLIIANVQPVIDYGMQLLDDKSYDTHHSGIERQIQLLMDTV